ncbi:MAG: glycosyltransferase family 1 protein [Planctomycetota bacterium]
MLDVSSAARKEKTGVAFYIENLLNAFASEETEHTFSLFYRFSRLKHAKFLPYIDSTNFKKAHSLASLICDRNSNIAHGLDSRILKIGKAKRVVTIHDTFSVISDKFADSVFRKKKKRYYTEIMRYADAVICDSKSTQRDFLSNFNYPEEKSSVVPLGVSQGFRQREHAECSGHLKCFGIPDKYILSVGTISTRKNTSAAIEVFDMAADIIPDISLVIAGKHGYGAEKCVEKASHARAKERIFFTGYVEADVLPYLYSGASLFLFPSCYEGFGLPVLEAMSSGVPVITSNTSSIPEVTGDSALRIDYNNVSELVETVIKVLTDNNLREKMVKSGLLQAKNFTWKETARKTLEVYNKITH